MSQDVNLSSQVALVTGAGRGLGRAFALALAGSGAGVAITARTESQLAETAKLIEKDGGRVIAFPSDVTDVSAIKEVVDEAERQLGKIDLLVNNAGVMNPLGYGWDSDIDEWWDLFSINVKGSYICMRAVLPSMMARGKGRIINVSSNWAHTVHPFAAAYSASKAALTHLTNNMAPPLREKGISIFAFGPSGHSDLIHLMRTSPDMPEEDRQRFLSPDYDEANDTRTDESVRMLMFLASGKADALTGRHMNRSDSPNELLQRTDEIIRDDLFTLRRHT